MKFKLFGILSISGVLMSLIVFFITQKEDVLETMIIVFIILDLLIMLLKQRKLQKDKFYSKLDQKQKPRNGYYKIDPVTKERIAEYKQTQFALLATVFAFIIEYVVVLIINYV